MIRLSKDRVLEDFFIDDNGIITNKEGEVQKIIIYNTRPWFKRTSVHQIQMWTKYGWRDTSKWVIHHKDENPLNNSIDNLVFLTRSEHTILHKTGKKLSKECKRKISETLKERNLSQPISDEIRKKLSLSMKGKHSGSKNPAFGRIWWTNGESNLYLKDGEIPPTGYYRGMTRRCKK